MRVVEFNDYGAARDVIRLVDNASIPVPGDSQILVRVIASSINPIDCAVRSGYGRELFKAKVGPEFPIRPGRDIAGYVEAVGKDVVDFKPGDAVYAGVLKDGIAEYSVVEAAHAAPKPKSLNFTEAASMPYVALTTWSALVDHAGLTAHNTKGKKIIIPRGAGGVGSFAIQLMKAWGAGVATVCSTRNIEIVKDLGADVVVDYTCQDFAEVLHDYDVAFDTAFDTEQKLLDTLKKGSDASYVSIVTPKIHMVDEFGVEEGLKRAGALFDQRVADQKALGRHYYWSFMEPNGDALRIISALVDSGKIKPLIDRIYTMDQTAEAQEYCETKQAQGKIVIRITDEEST